MAIVFINSDSGEDYITVDTNEGDRNNLTAWHGGDDLVKTVAGNNRNTIVVIHSVGPLILEEWIEHENVTAVLWAGLPGQESEYLFFLRLTIRQVSEGADDLRSRRKCAC